ncbi:arf-GAP with coiled-coil, ANK repeat and PH domain-containing protein 1 [Chelonoidis abingdonii]|uniref:arf-GAP with coiled-coil, ANK repeat and PH domain-containing protein 1 n=1 Tax=Chelonoidis abingdonii TaxID=106734 RepID=UPI003F4928EE
MRPPPAGRALTAVRRWPQRRRALRSCRDSSSLSATPHYGQRRRRLYGRFVGLLSHSLPDRLPNLPPRFTAEVAQSFAHQRFRALRQRAIPSHSATAPLRQHAATLLRPARDTCQTATGSFQTAGRALLMTVKLDFEECLKDSPRFSQHPTPAHNTFPACVFQTPELLDSTQQSSRQHIHTLVKEDVKRFKEARKEFERGSEGLASALHHNAEVPRRKQQEAEEAALALQAARTSARARALDYVLQINVIQSKKKFEILQFVSRVMVSNILLNPDLTCSTRLGITLCIECSGIHRSLGVHFSKVRSLTLDSWEPELVKLMCELGNETLNRIYEARVDEMTVKRPQPGCSRAEKESWIRAKYVEKKFITKLPEARLTRGGRRGPSDRDRPPRPPLKPKPGSISRAAELGEAGSPPEDLRSLHPGALLYWAAGHQNLPTMADALAHGADVNWVNTAEESRTPLLRAVAANSLLACEFLLQNGANVNQADSAGRGPLHHATILGHTGCVWPRCGRRRYAQGTATRPYLDIFRDSPVACDNPEKN